jgi:HEAT repeat protein
MAKRSRLTITYTLFCICISTIASTIAVRWNYLLCYHKLSKFNSFSTAEKYSAVQGLCSCREEADLSEVQEWLIAQTESAEIAEASQAATALVECRMTRGIDAIINRFVGNSIELAKIRTLAAEAPGIAADVLETRLQRLEIDVAIPASIIDYLPDEVLVRISRLLTSKDESIRVKAARFISDCLTRASHCTENLKLALVDSSANVRFHALRAFSNIEAKHLENDAELERLLAASLGDNDDRIVSITIDILNYLRIDNSTVQGELLRGITRFSGCAQLKAAGALVDRGVDCSDCAAMVEAGFRSDEPHTRLCAIRTAAKLANRPDIQDAIGKWLAKELHATTLYLGVRALRESQVDKTPLYEQIAATRKRVLKRIMRDGHGVDHSFKLAYDDVNLLLNAINHQAFIALLFNDFRASDSGVKLKAIKELQEYESDLDGKVIPQLVSLLKDESKFVRNAAVIALGEVAKRSKDPGLVAKLLKNCSQDVENIVRESAEQALRKIEANSTSAAK